MGNLSKPYHPESIRGISVFQSYTNSRSLHNELASVPPGTVLITYYLLGTSYSGGVCLIFSFPAFGIIHGCTEISDWHICDYI